MNNTKIKTRLKGRKIHCENFLCDELGKCGKYADDHHHLYSNTRKAREVYGDLIDMDFNIIYVNHDCHLRRVIPKLTEIQFRELAEQFGYSLPFSKTLQFKKFN